MKIEKLYYVCPRCQGLIDAPTHVPQFVMCPRPETYKYVDGRRVLADPGCRNNPPYTAETLQTKIVEVEVEDNERA